MAGDITRSTFDPKKGYTSVRMQQGRLQLDADWNEQADIQNHLRRAYVTDMIGAGSGASKVDPFTGNPSDTSFELRAIATPPLSDPSATDIALLPGHFYTRGVLCELAPESSFKVRKLDNQRLQISPSLTIDGRRLQVGDWLVPADLDFTDLSVLPGWRIETIVDPKNREVEVVGDLQDLEDSQMRRVVTYRSQPDWPVDPSSSIPEDAIYFAYLDVWERPVTAVDDPTLREVALNVPDTTTRTKTVWQLKLRQPDETIQVNQLQETAAIATDWPQPWRDFEQAERDRAPLMNACARLCADGTTGSNGRLGNYLYRVEIHHGNDPAISATSGNDNGNGNQAVTFKWSRNNGSVVSPVKAIEGNVIRISKSSQDAWADSTPGQWLELLTTAQELRGEPGLLVPLRSAADTKLEFDDALIVGGSIPKNVSKVRRWDHTVTDTRQGVLAISSNWVELENGIKVQFAVTETSEPAESNGDTASDQAAETVPIIYRTGDYWLIPARAATNDIEWPSDRADDDVSNQGVSISRPLSQPPHGIEHQYALLGIVEISNQAITQVYDQRILFPPLLRALDREGGEIAGDLEIRGQFSVMGLEADPETDQEADTQAARLIVLKNGNVGVGTAEPQHTLDVSGTLQTTDLQVTNRFASERFEASQYKIALNPTSDNPVLFGIIQAHQSPDGESPESRQIQFVAEPEISFAFLDGNVEIGRADAPRSLNVEGSINGREVLKNGEAIALQADLIALEGQLNNLQNQVSTFQSQVDNLQGQVGTLQGQVGTLQGQMAAVQGGITTLQGQFDSLQEQINSLQGQFDSLRDRVESFEGRLDSLQEQINSLQGQFDPLRDRVESFEERLDSLQEQLESLQQKYNTLQGNLSNLRNDFVDHVDSDNPNPHGITAQIINALPLSGGDIGGRLGAETLSVGTHSIPDVTSPATLYVKGNLYVDGDPANNDEGKIFAQKVEGIDVQANSFVQVSSQTLKENITELSRYEVAEALGRLHPVKFRYKQDVSDQTSTGFLAEEVPDFLATPDRHGVKLMDVIAVLTKAVQEHRHVVKQLSAKLKKQDQEIAQLKQTLSNIIPPDS